jgi:hypothetical protein
MKRPRSWDSETNERLESITADKCLKMTVVKALDGKLFVTMKDEGGSLLNDMFDSRDGAEQVPVKVSRTFTVFYELKSYMS